MIRKFQLGIALLAVSFGSWAADDFKLCRDVFANGNPPVLLNQENLQPRALCFESFAVMHSGKRHTPIYVAERLNSAVLQQAKSNQRTNKFYADARLPRAERAELDDYRGSGFDRGHMAPAGDMAGDVAMAQSFSLANMVPQYSVNNRKAWAGIEKATRKYVMRAPGNVYVITGPVFDGTPPTIGTNRVWVPQHLFKLVYDPSNGRSWVNWLDNTDQAKPGKPISYEELVRRTGIEFLPVKA
jgi:endonuclease G